MHTGEKDFCCEFCSQRFSCKEYLVLHRRIHTAEKPFRCETCGKCFTQKTSLTVHRRYHTGQKPYLCECGRGFVTKSHLMNHYKTHEANTTTVDFNYINENSESYSANT